MNVREIFKRKSIRYGLAGFATSVVVYGIVLAGSPIVAEYRGSFAAKEFKEYGVLGAYQKRFFSFQVKLDEMKALDSENQALSRKVATLEKEVELARSSHAETEAEILTAEASKRLKIEAGSELARVLSSIEYQVPSQLLPPQLYTLAIGYFRKQEYEQAAVILSKLIELKEDTSYQKAEAQLMCGIAWYKLKHFKLSHFYLSQAKFKAQPTDTVYRTALVWDALVAKAQGKSGEANSIVTGIISRYPHSEEAGWVNHSGEDRKPAAHGHERMGFERHKEVREESHESVESKEAEHGADSHTDSKHETQDKPAHADEEGAHHE